LAIVSEIILQKIPNNLALSVADLDLGDARVYFGIIVERCLDDIVLRMDGTISGIDAIIT
jgi:hypothetical protein